MANKFRKLLINSSGCFAVLFLIGYVASYFDWTASLGWIGLFSLGTPFFLLLAFVFFSLWLLTKNIRSFLVGNIVLFFGISMYWGWSRRLDIENNFPEKTIRIMSYNVNLFEFYKWDNTGIGNRVNMIGLINNENPDIACLQEFYSIHHPRYNFNTLDTLISLMPGSMYKFNVALHASQNQQLGLIVFSKFPIVNDGRVSLTSDGINSCMFADILIHHDTIRVYNVHLESINLTSPTKKRSLSLVIEKTNQFLQGFKFRAQQAKIIKNHMDNCRFPIIICGDFNDSPSSYVYHHLLMGLKDCFYETGGLWGSTYAGKIPGLRIDYILFSNHFRCDYYHLIPKAYSDHYPIVTGLTYHH